MQSLLVRRLRAVMGERELHFGVRHRGRAGEVVAEFVVDVRVREHL